jgi:hypothetical protein
MIPAPRPGILLLALPDQLRIPIPGLVLQVVVATDPLPPTSFLPGPINWIIEDRIQLDAPDEWTFLLMLASGLINYSSMAIDSIKIPQGEMHSRTSESKNGAFSKFARWPAGTSSSSSCPGSCNPILIL